MSPFLKALGGTELMLVASQNKTENHPAHAAATPLSVAPPWGELSRTIRPRPVWRALEFVIAGTLIVLTAPLLLLAALLVKLTSRGPVIYSQTRLGLNGRPFSLFKVRTMIHDCESLTGARWSIPGDPRITPVGQLLRRSHLDELPQLWNILRGEMSLIGPRPERPEFIPGLERALPNYRLRLLVRPGVSGLAQVQLRADTDLASVRRKLSYDLYYVGHASLLLDLRLVLCTAAAVFGMPALWLRRLLRIPGVYQVEGPDQPSREVWSSNLQAA
jgi:lipopolysaccharide/colanic/teichoic acid biosynthesis glycosyltransferase